MKSLKQNIHLTRFGRYRTSLTVLIVGTILLVACAGNDELETEIESLTEAYAEAQKNIDRGNYSRGVQIFEAIQARYPFSDLSRQVQLELM
jgi:outer membrane protein assembly factor BamD